MDAKDLMIGDLVTFKDCQNDENPMPIEIVALGYQQGDGRESSLVSINGDKACDIFDIDDEIVGIPLTAEILEKNFDKRPECYGIFDDYFDFMVREYSDGIFIANYHHCEMSLPDTQIADIAFVHELQHTLKLCGISLDIKI